MKAILKAVAAAGLALALGSCEHTEGQANAPGAGARAEAAPTCRFDRDRSDYERIVGRLGSAPTAATIEENAPALLAIAERSKTPAASENAARKADCYGLSVRAYYAAIGSLTSARARPAATEIGLVARAADAVCGESASPACAQVGLNGALAASILEVNTLLTGSGPPTPHQPEAWEATRQTVNRYETSIAAWGPARAPFDAEAQSAATAQAQMLQVACEGLRGTARWNRSDVMDEPVVRTLETALRASAAASEALRLPLSSDGATVCASNDPAQVNTCRRARLLALTQACEPLLRAG